mgnify:CR=1 FL=1
MTQIISLVRKELKGYFGSPMALIFVGVFLAGNLFVFFWVDAFWARGVAYMRPMFRWMPVLLIFLIAALTMRQWSEEEQTGTLEVLLTMPIQTIQLVIGKFLAALALVGVALALTLFLPITVALIGNLDVGPVIGGYLAEAARLAPSALAASCSTTTKNSPWMRCSPIFWPLSARAPNPISGGCSTPQVWSSTPIWAALCWPQKRWPTWRRSPAAIPTSNSIWRRACAASPRCGC